MNLVEQIFAQAQMGTGRDTGNPFAQGLQLGMEQQRIDVAKRQLAAELAMQPIKQTLMQQESEMAAFKLNALKEQRDLELANEQDVQNLSNIIAQSQASANPEDSEAYIWEAISRNGKLMKDPRVKTMFDEVKSSLAAKMQLQALKNANDSTFESPQIKLVDDPSNPGNPLPVLQKGKGSWEPVTENVVEFKAPDGTIVTQRTGRAGGNVSGLQSSVVADVEKKLAANDTGLSLLSQSMDQISPDTVGPQGILREGIEVAGNIIAPGSVPTTTTKARQTFRLTAQQQYNALKADSQINKLEASAMEKIANITGMAESDPTAREKYGILRDLTALRSVLLNHQLNKFAPDTALKAMSPEQAARAWKRGDLTNAEIERWNELHQFVK